jgi:hypothetical protein
MKSTSRVGHAADQDRKKASGASVKVTIGFIEHFATLEPGINIDESNEHNDYEHTAGGRSACK